MTLSGLRIGLVGPLPPPAGGMAGQTRHLAELLQREGAAITLVRSNAPYWPQLVAGVRGVRALFRLAPFVVRLWGVAGRVDLLHIMANSGWSWHLVAAPAVWVARLRGTPTVVHYHGGEAETFLARASRVVRATLRLSNALVVPSAFLGAVFARHGIGSVVVPNVIDLDRFRPAAPDRRPTAPHLVCTRNLEAIYDVSSALRALALLRKSVPEATMTVAGSGPERMALEALREELGLVDAVRFSGQLDRDQMAELIRSAAVLVNPSRADNLPISVLEAMASGVPVVSTNVGGVPFILRDGVTGLLVDPGDCAAVTAAVQHILDDERFASRIRDAALADVQQYAWSRVRQKWAEVYISVLPRGVVEARPT